MVIEDFIEDNEVDISRPLSKDTLAKVTERVSRSHIERRPRSHRSQLYDIWDVMAICKDNWAAEYMIKRVLRKMRISLRLRGGASSE
jgi:hypothetical protein